SVRRSTSTSRPPSSWSRFSRAARPPRRACRSATSSSRSAGRASPIPPTSRPHCGPTRSARPSRLPCYGAVSRVIYRSSWASGRDGPRRMDMLIDIAELAEELRRVTVEVTDADELLGSGILWPAGCVVTNAHVVRRPEVALRLSDGRRLRARVVARDSDADLALLDVPGTGVPSAALAEPDTIRVGSFVVAIGHPLRGRGARAAGVTLALGP